MNTDTKSTTIILQEISIEEMPFVNEACGDTMWDEVLENMEDKPNKE